MERFEYKKVIWDEHPYIEDLNTEGACGWELVMMERYLVTELSDPNMKFNYYGLFKRKITNENI